VKTDTIVKPYTVVIKLLNTHVAFGTMFRSCGFDNFASLALVFRLKDNLFIVKSFNSCLKIIRGHVPWADETSLEVSKIAEYHNEGSDVLVIPIDIGVRNMVEAVEYINVKATECASEVY
jgi:hypothetical protein